MIQDAIKKHKKNYNLIYLRADNLNELKEKFSKKDENSALLFIRFYKNRDGHLNKNQEIARFIKLSKLPVFITDSIFIKKGALGGKIVDLNEFGVKSSQMALSILSKDKHSIEIFKNFTNVFDEQKIKEFLIFPSSFVKNYTLVNRSQTFYDKHKGFISVVFTLSPFLLLLIIGLIHNIYMRKEVEKDLRQRIDFDEVLLNAIESPIFWQNEKNVIVDSNSKFCSLLKLSCKELYGKKLEDFSDNKNVRKIIKVLQKYKENEKRIMSLNILTKI